MAILVTPPNLQVGVQALETVKVFWDERKMRKNFNHFYEFHKYFHSL